jgi:hypothetical protein
MTQDASSDSSHMITRAHSCTVADRARHTQAA